MTDEKLKELHEQFNYAWRYLKAHSEIPVDDTAADAFSAAYLDASELSQDAHPLLRELLIACYRYLNNDFVARGGSGNLL